MRLMQFISKQKFATHIVFTLLAFFIVIISIKADFSTRPLRVYGTSDLLGSGSAVATFSSDGSLVLVGGSGAVTLWNTETGIQVQNYLAGYDVRAVDFSPDAAAVLVGYGTTAAIFDSQTGLPLRTVSGHGGTNWVDAVQFSPDGTNFLTASRVDGTRLWDAYTGDQISRISSIGNYRAVFSPDGTQILLAQANIAILRDIDTGVIIQTFSGHTGTITAVAFSPDGTQILTGSNDRQAKLWNVISGNLIQTYVGHLESVYTVAFSPDGTKIITGSGSSSPSNDSSVKLWDKETGIVIREFLGHSEVVISSEFSPNGLYLLTGSTGYDAAEVILWNMDTGAEIYRFGGSNVGSCSVAFSPDGNQLVTASGWGTFAEFFARVWNTQSAQLTGVFQGHTYNVLDAVFSPDGTKILTGSMDGTARIWEVATEQELSSFVDPSFRFVNAVAYSPDGNYILTGSSLLGASSPEAIVWDVNTGDVVQSFMHMQDINSVAFSPDGTKIATGSGRESSTQDRTARIWNISTGQELHQFTLNGESIRSVAFSHDGTQLVAAGDDWIARTWDVDTGETIRTYIGHTDQILAAAFSPDDTRLITGSADGSIKLWDTTTSNILRSFEFPYEQFGTCTSCYPQVCDVAYSPDGTKIAGAYQGVALLWDSGNNTADLSVSQSTSANSIVVGESITYTLVVQNNSMDIAQDVLLSDFLPFELSLQSTLMSQGSCSESYHTLSCNLGDLESSGLVTITLGMISIQAGIADNTAIVSSLAIDPNPSNNNSVWSVDIQEPTVPVADLEMNKTSSATVISVGQVFTYTLAVTNHGPMLATNVHISDTVPTQLSVVSFFPTNNCSIMDRTVQCTIDSLGPGENQAVTIQVLALVPGNVTNTAVVESSTQDTNFLNNLDSVEVMISAGLDTDNDGVSDEIENGAPNQGDGNQDNIPDSQQAHVASLLDIQDSYITLVSPIGTSLTSVFASTNPAPSTAPSTVEFPVGFLSFGVSNVPIGGETLVTFLFHGSPIHFDSFWKFDENTASWDSFLYDGYTGAMFFSGEVWLYFQDGGRGDADNLTNGEILDPGAPGISSRSVFLPIVRN
jgi:uncharacterized repeat protein (TIGR01451 family)